MANNMKKIREIYGATQDEIAKVAGVTRSTISQWETGAAKASNTKLEKLSIFYGIGPESFYELEYIDEERRKILVSMSQREKEITEASENKRNKASEIAKMIEDIDFVTARKRYTMAMKLLLATADSASLEDLKVACDINKKMLRRLEAVIKIREEEERDKAENNEKTLYDLLDELY